MHRTRAGRIAAAVIVALLASVGLVATPAYAAEAEYTISGHVFLGDDSRSAAAGEVTVTARGSGGLGTFTTTTDDSGNYSLPVTTINSARRFLLSFTTTAASEFSGVVYPNYPIGAYSGTRLIEVTADRPGTDVTLPRPVTVSGRVLLAPTYAPAAAGEVAVSWHQMSAGSTAMGPWSTPQLVDADGRYSFSLPGGYYEFRFVYQGADGPYQTSINEMPGQFAPYPILASDLVLNTRTLYPENSINGVVQLGEASPRFAAAGEVLITLNTKSTYWGAGTPVPGFSATTDSLGRFTLEDVPPGEYSLNYDWVGTPPAAFADIENRGFIQLSARDVELATVQRLTRLGTVSGHIYLGDTDHPAPAGTVLVDYGYLPNYGPDQAVTVGAGGAYTLTGVPEATDFEVRARYVGDEPYRTRTRNHVTLGAVDITGLDIVLLPSTGLGGTVTDTSGSPIAAATVELLMLGDDDIHAYRTVMTDADGGYSFHDVGPGTYSVLVSADGYATTQWDRVPGYYVPDFFSITEQQFLTGIDISLAPEGVVHGTVTGVRGDDSDVQVYAVALQVYDSASKSWVEVDGVEIAQDGSYRFDGLAADSYRLRAYYAGPQGEATMISPVLEVDEGSDTLWSPKLRPWTRDISGDEVADVLGRGATGNLVMYTGTGYGTLGPSSLVATGWSGYVSMVQAGDVDGDDQADIFVRDRAGSIWLYRGYDNLEATNCCGISATRELVDTGWQSYRYVLSPGDVNGDGVPDLMALDTRGRLWLYGGDGDGAFLDPVIASTGWSGPTAFVTPGDFDSDGYPDLIVRDRVGDLWLYRGTAAGTFSNLRTRIGRGWQNATAIFSLGDFNGDWNPDLLGRGATGVLYTYAGNGAGALGPAYKLNAGWQKATFVL